MWDYIFLDDRGKFYAKLVMVTNLHILLQD
jgi:hypothetical protein